MCFIDFTLENGCVLQVDSPRDSDFAGLRAGD